MTTADKKEVFLLFVILVFFIIFTFIGCGYGTNQQLFEDQLAIDKYLIRHPNCKDIKKEIQ